MRNARLPMRTLGMAVVLAALVVLTVVPAAVAGGPTKAPQAGPVTEGFVQSMIGVTGGFGKRPNPVPFTLNATATARAARRVLPSYFSLIDEGRLTAVRNQGNYGTCWAFANLAAVESRLRPGQTWDFSEDNLVTRSGFGPFGGTSRYDWGGWDLMAIAYLTRWAGPVNQSDDPYHTPTPPRVNRVRKHVQGAVMIPGRSGDLDNDLIKQLVMANGALSVGMQWDSSPDPDPYNYKSSGYATYYLPEAKGENHGVDVVGWDDAFPAADFAGGDYGLPPGDGAFLVRNSWTKYWGDNGYFWVSYYDQSFARDQGLDYGGCTSYSMVSSAGNYHRQYSYDKLGATAHYGYNASQVWGANRFTAKATENITAAGFYTLQSGTAWQMWAGRSWSTLTLRASDTSALPGYQTITFASPLPVTKGDKFIVAIRLVSPTEMYPLACEVANDSWQAGATASAGQSYMRYGDAAPWDDISRFEHASVCLKAFAN